MLLVLRKLLKNLTKDQLRLETFLYHMADDLWQAMKSTAE